MKRVLIAIVLLFAASSLHADIVDDLLVLPEADRARVAKAFPGPSPLLSPEGARFLWHGEANSVRLAGDMTDWKPTLELARIPGTDLWHLAWPSPADARVDYKLVVDGRWILDPLNPLTCEGGFGPNSELRMPGAQEAPELDATGLPPATIHAHEGIGGDPRTVKVLLPPGYRPDTPRPALLVHDGHEFISLGALARVIAWLAANEPDLVLPICVCVPPVDRTLEYAGWKRTDFMNWLTDSVIPFVESRYAVAPGRSWGSLGASNGGNISLELALAHPERIGAVIALSPYVSPEVMEGFSKLPEAPALYLNWGSYDIQRLLPIIDEFVATLDGAGIPHSGGVLNEGHSWGLWRATVDEGLRAVYGEGR